MLSLRFALSLSFLVVTACGAKVAFVGEDGGGGSQQASTIGVGASSGDGAGFVGFGGETGTGGITGTGGACSDGTIQLTNPPPLTIDGVCGWGAQSTTRPVAYFFSGGAEAGLLVIEGCVGGTNTQLSLSVVVDGPGTYTSGDAFFFDPNGASWQSTMGGFVVSVDALGKIGGSVDGSAKLELSDGNGAILDLPAVFHVCRVEDQNLP